MLTKDSTLKLLQKNRQPIWGYGQWPAIGEWHTVKKQLQMCENGLHITNGENLWYWLTEAMWWSGPLELYTVEVYNPTNTKWWAINDDRKIVVRMARLTQLLDLPETLEEVLYRIVPLIYPSRSAEILDVRSGHLTYASLRQIDNILNEFHRKFYRIMYHLHHKEFSPVMNLIKALYVQTTIDYSQIMLDVLNERHFSNVD